MNRRDIANLALRIVGLYCLIEVIQNAHYTLFMIRTVGTATATGSHDRIVTLAAAAPLTLLFLLGLYLIFRAPRLAARVFPEPQPDSAPPERMLALHALAYSVVGIFVLVDALPQLLYAVVSAWFSWNDLQLDHLLRMVCVPGLELGLGIALFFGSHGLVRLWSRLRYAGIREKLGLCSRCGYDLTGNTTGTCPECGTPTKRQAE